MRTRGSSGMRNGRAEVRVQRLLPIQAANLGSRARGLYCALHALAKEGRWTGVRHETGEGTHGEEAARAVGAIAGRRSFSLGVRTLADLQGHAGRRVSRSDDHTRGLVRVWPHGMARLIGCDRASRPAAISPINDGGQQSLAPVDGLTPLPSSLEKAFRQHVMQSAPTQPELF